MIPVQSVRKSLVDLGVEQATLVIDGVGYEYREINASEFQFGEVGDMPTNYDDSLEPGQDLPALHLRLSGRELEIALTHTKVGTAVTVTDDREDDEDSVTNVLHLLNVLAANGIVRLVPEGAGWLRCGACGAVRRVGCRDEFGIGCPECNPMEPRVPPS